jgi:HK97 family phage prohead protease
MFLPGAFDARDARREPDLAELRARAGFAGIIGHGSELRDHEDGLHGSFRVGADSDAEKALQYVHEGILGGVSLEFRSRKTQTVDGVRQRVKAIVDKVSLCRFPAYPNAEVIAVRTEPVAREPVLNPGIDELLARVGYEPLLARAVTTRPWDGSPARFSDEQYLRSCLIVRPGDAPAKERGSLPVLEPDGTVNANALGAAAAPPRQGRRRNVTGRRRHRPQEADPLLRQAGMEPPASLRRWRPRELGPSPGRALPAVACSSGRTQRLGWRPP